MIVYLRICLIYPACKLVSFLRSNILSCVASLAPPYFPTVAHR